MIKLMIKLAIAVMILLVGGVVSLFLGLDHIVKTTIESQASEQTKVTTTLGGVTLGLFNGTLGLDQMNVGSPAGFSAPQMLSVGSINVDTGGLGHLRQQPIHLASINIAKPVLVVEQANGRLNFKELMNNLSPPGKKPTAPATSTDKSSVKLVIDSLKLTGGHVVMKSGIPGLDKEIDIPLPDMVMKNIGNADGAQNGAAIKDVLASVITQMVQQATGSPNMPISIRPLMDGNLKDIQSQLTGIAQQKLQGLVPDNINNAVNNLLGGKKDDKAK